MDQAQSHSQTQSKSRKRPWLAAVLGLLITGLGQIYLRRWLRALGWLALAFLVGGLFVPESVLTDPMQASFWDAAPLLAVGVASVLDAYVLARQHNRQIEVQEANLCASCHRELEDDVSFCPWCATETPTTADH
ncbi:uncharacterized protein Nmag_3887 (plasmid) [Natrialba magadii ATCC 43099]|uniref:DUF7575 domain-containing protein n=1 Tax=Natrialba magadii (strain ATCC 43099 / DSM 3394 / CCM 3739 / CIP 104546 / IAM 13178 / JCM 8861 / NBRC 102185 / NCIMB 2190 / MS3) TaxID=547559 RepID=D3T1G9_NATMM|nr:zinc ribbon domain-containing protein [Natrialba magadii]ADD07428.1 uncharacterized protein Nmag_3887 [Natrialba magadii ATCC 43099]ELY32236.1 hypothetical protein C500_04139 [Natrialba magadii ATCC 43099]